MELTCMHHELQKATDALRKATGVKMLELQQIIEKSQDNSGGEEDIAYPDAELSDSSIVEEIQSASQPEEENTLHDSNDIEEK